jgi:thiamine biosynthesis lipoprotein
MTAAMRWTRRARPMLGTLVELGVDPAGRTAIDAAFATILRLQSQLSAFEPTSDVGRFNAMPEGASFIPGAATHDVLRAAQALRRATAGAFDITLGTGLDAWHLDGARLTKCSPGVRLDLGGIAKGYIVDRAVEALCAGGAAAGWVNAGGDLRAFGDVDVPVMLRDEAGGGTRPFARLRDGAFATSHYGSHSRSRLAGRADRGAARHVSVAAPLCMWADALTKVVALTGDTSHRLLARHGAQAWSH